MSVKYLEKYLNFEVIVTLTEGGYIRGILKGYDQHMNIVIEDGELINEREKIKIGSLVLRGAAIVSISEGEKF
ncbi:MAG: LSM domain-containing protein [Candidatus Asgardarchaeia archaeon]